MVDLLKSLNTIFLYISVLGSTVSLSMFHFNLSGVSE